MENNDKNWRKITENWVDEEENEEKLRNKSIKFYIIAIALHSLHYRYIYSFSSFLVQYWMQCSVRRKWKILEKEVEVARITDKMWNTYWSLLRIFNTSIAINR